MTHEIVPVWKAVTPEVGAGLDALWARKGAIPDGPDRDARASQAVCIARDPAHPDAIDAVGTAVLRVLPRLRQPMYYYRQYFAEAFRGHRQTIPFFNRARQVLQAYNASLARPEALGVLLEIENPMLAKRYDRAVEADAGSVFIGYSPRGLQLRVSYFDDARLLPPSPPPSPRPLPRGRMQG
jgi:hypothetical protein